MEATWQLGGSAAHRQLSRNLLCSLRPFFPNPAFQPLWKGICKEFLVDQGWQECGKVHPKCIPQGYPRDLRGTMARAHQGQGLGLLSYVQESSTCEITTVFLPIYCIQDIHSSLSPHVSTPPLTSSPGQCLHAAPAADCVISSNCSVESPESLSERGSFQAVRKLSKMLGFLVNVLPALHAVWNVREGKQAPAVGTVPTWAPSRGTENVSSQVFPRFSHILSATTQNTHQGLHSNVSRGVEEWFSR